MQVTGQKRKKKDIYWLTHRSFYNPGVSYLGFLLAQTVKTAKSPNDFR